MATAFMRTEASAIHPSQTNNFNANFEVPVFSAGNRRRRLIVEWRALAGAISRSDRYIHCSSGIIFAGVKFILPRPRIKDL